MSLDVQALVQRHDLEKVTESANSEYYALPDGVLVTIPFEGSTDDRATAEENKKIQNAYYEERGRKGGIVIFFDRMKSQDKDARKVYETVEMLTCTAMVGGSLLTRAMFSFFIGISRPTMPIKLFADFESAVRWVREQQAAAAAT
ncbi:MAG: hypothetical protein AAGA56_00830 [Myxococcota bacterium]